jgi:hypothetical protein
MEGDERQWPVPLVIETKGSNNSIHSRFNNSIHNKGVRLSMCTIFRIVMLHYCVYRPFHKSWSRRKWTCSKQQQLFILTVVELNIASRTGPHWNLVEGENLFVCPYRNNTDSRYPSCKPDSVRRSGFAFCYSPPADWFRGPPSLLLKGYRELISLS